jgi:hypothetical protein
VEIPDTSVAHAKLAKADFRAECGTWA